MRRDEEQGFVLISVALCAVTLVGLLGLAVDLGRLYVIKSEAQAYADSAALAAALELDSTATGLARARSAVAQNLNRWNLATAVFTGTATDFATSASGPWQANPSPAAGYRFVRVRASATAPLFFLPAVGTALSASIRASAVAGQAPKTNFTEGVLPFSPFAHNNSPPNFGLTPGQLYTLRWPANPKAGQNVCPGDDVPGLIALAEAGNASERGFIEETSSAVIRAAIEQDYQTKPVVVGQAVEMTGGAKQTQRDSLINRVNQDTDPTSATYAQYEAAGRGNGRRLVAAPINSGHPDFIVRGIALFFLLRPSQYDQGPNKPFCAEYLGPYVQGSGRKGAGEAGAYVVRLVG